MSVIISFFNCLWLAAIGTYLFFLFFKMLLLLHPKGVSCTTTWHSFIWELCPSLYGNVKCAITEWGSACVNYDFMCNGDNWIIMSEKPNQKSPKRHVSGQQQLAPQTGGAAPKLSAVGRRYSMCVPAISLTTTVSLDSHGSMDPPPTLDLVPLRRTSSNKYHPKSLLLICSFVGGQPGNGGNYLSSTYSG